MSAPALGLRLVEKAPRVTRACDTCIYFQSTGNNGICRFYPPASGPSITNRWAIVQASDWCGEWTDTDPAVTPPLMPVVSGTAAAPAGTASASAVMMGLGLLNGFSITPNTTGRVAAMICGIVSASGANAQLAIGGRHGTGTAPANGATASGTVWSIEQDYSISAAKDAVGFTGVGGNVGLALGTPVWFDLAVSAAAGGTVSLTDVQALLWEL